MIISQIGHLAVETLDQHALVEAVGALASDVMPHRPPTP